MGNPGRLDGVTGIAARAAMWSARHRAFAIIGWLVFAVGVAILGGQVGMVNATSADYGVGDSGRADRVIAQAGFPDRAGEMVIVQGKPITDPAFRAAIRDAVADIQATGQVEDLVTPTPDNGLTSSDGRSALITFTMKGDAETAKDRVGAVLAAVDRTQRAHPDLYVAEAGDASGGKLVGDELDKGLNRLSMLSIPVSLGILLVAFGAIVAALLPVGLAVTAVVAAFGLLAFASRAAPTADTTMHMMLLIGLAVGVDYCLFYIRRERDERAKGADPHRALVVAAQTSGRSVWISGLTVMIAMAGMLFTRDTTFTSFAVGTILVVATAVLGSLTVLPALLSTLGDRVDLGGIPGLYRRRTRGRVWSGLMRVVLLRPLVSAVLAAVALGALAWPALHMHPTGSSLDDISPRLPIVQAFHRIQKAFPGGGDPARVVVRAPDLVGATFDPALAEFKRRAVATGQLHEPITVEFNPDRTVAVISVGLSGSGTDRSSERALYTLRDTVLPATLERMPDAWVGVTGTTADSHDFNNQLRRSIPLVFAFVLALAFVLLLVSFRSMVVAVTSVLLNLLSVAAAYGMLVFVFQDGHGERLLDFTSSGGITNWMPLLLFVVLFGLSMDYHVFVLSRIREGHDRGLPTRRAVADGIVGTAGVITSAAVVMVAVFLLFTTLPLTSTKELGVGLAAAVLLDATLVRAVLLPSVMAMLGERNWYLPRWLAWLPQTAHRPPGQPAPERGPSHVEATLAGRRPLS